MPLSATDTLANGQYRILRHLGGGGSGFVYQAQDTLLRDEVAIKELIPALVGDESMLKRFVAKARAVMRLPSNHMQPNSQVLPGLGAKRAMRPRIEGTELPRDTFSYQGG